MAHRERSRRQAPGPKARSPLAQLGRAGRADADHASPAGATLSAQAQLRDGDRFSSGTATLERERLAFRGYFQYELAFADIRSVQLLRDILKLETPSGYVTLKLGKQAAAWAEFIRTHR